MFCCVAQGVCNHSLTTDCSTINHNTGGGITRNSTELACIVPRSERYQACSLVLRPRSCDGHAIPSSEGVEVIYSMTEDGQWRDSTANIQTFNMACSTCGGPDPGVGSTALTICSTVLKYQKRTRTK